MGAIPIGTAFGPVFTDRMRPESFATILVSLRGLTDILGDLRAWTEQREPHGFVLPQVYHDRGTRKNKQEVLARGVEGALAVGGDLTPDQCGELDPDSGEALALAVILQAYEFFRNRGWDGIDASELTWTLSRLKHAQDLIDPLMTLLSEQPGASDRQAVIDKLEATGKHLNQAVKEGTQVVGDHGDELETGELGSLPSFDSFPDSVDELLGDEMLEPSTQSQEIERASAETQRDESVEAALDESERREKVKRDHQEERHHAATRRQNRLRYVGPAMLPVLVALALLSVWPWLKSGSNPKMDDYSDIVPVQHVIRIRGEAPRTVFVVAEGWDRLDSNRQLQDLMTLYDRAQALEDATTIVVRDATGLDLARVEEGSPVLLQ